VGGGGDDPLPDSGRCRIGVLGLGENRTVEVLHSSIWSLTWVALATLLSLTRTLPTEHRTNRSQT
jgi:hypothetical protein